MNKRKCITERDGRKRKLALVTWFGCAFTGYNYGTCLQSFALQHKLLGLGYIIKLLPERLSSNWTTLLVRPEYFLHIIASYSCVELFTHMVLKFASMIYKGKDGLAETVQDTNRANKFRLWEQKHYDTAVVSTRNDWKEFLNSVDCFISGSDQIWNSYNNYNPFWFLGFASGKKISYASSIGTATINPKYERKIRAHLLQFSHISVREHSAIEPLQLLTGRHDIKQVMDPTFLLSSDEWNTIANEVSFEKKLPEHYVLCYFLGRNPCYSSQVQSVMHVYDASKVVIVRSLENPNFTIDGCIEYGVATPSEFVALIRNAAVVCTDSFHGTALCINLSVQFVEFRRFNDDDIKSQNSRIYNLLECFNLSNRLFSSDEQSWRIKIDYENIKPLVCKCRLDSLEYLINAIES